VQTSVGLHHLASFDTNSSLRTWQLFDCVTTQDKSECADCRCVSHTHRSFRFHVCRS